MLSSEFIKLKGVQIYPMLRAVAKRAGYRSLTALCRDCGISPQNVQRWKNNPPPGWKLLQKLLEKAAETMPQPEPEKTDDEW